jgi:hypothetical protein
MQDNKENTHYHIVKEKVIYWLNSIIVIMVN